jgi:hypothetical protein
MDVRIVKPRHHKTAFEVNNLRFLRECAPHGFVIANSYNLSILNRQRAGPGPLRIASPDASIEKAPIGLRQHRQSHKEKAQGNGGKFQLLHNDMIFSYTQSGGTDFNGKYLNCKDGTR